jgi:hypothetical protein
MTNEPNFKPSKITLSVLILMTTNHEQRTAKGKNEPKRTQFRGSFLCESLCSLWQNKKMQNKPNFKISKITLTSFLL